MNHLAQTQRPCADDAPNAVIHVGSCMDVLEHLQEGMFQTCVTSPPYWKMRDYEAQGQLGLEDTPEQYVGNLVAVMRKVRRVLRHDGTLWLNLGDTYAQIPRRRGLKGSELSAVAARKLPEGIKPKDKLGIPWMVAFALRADGWFLRQDVIWSKQCPAPESVKDRPSTSHEHLFLLSKSQQYFYDADALRTEHVARRRNKNGAGALRGQRQIRPAGRPDSEDRWFHPAGANDRSVWEIPMEDSDGAHPAVMPRGLARKCILAGTSQKGRCPSCGEPLRRVVQRIRTLDGQPAELPRMWSADGGGPKRSPGPGHNRIATEVRLLGWQSGCSCEACRPVPCLVLDPFGGHGTTAVEAIAHGRSAVLIEINPSYAAQARSRIDSELPLLQRAAASQPSDEKEPS